MQSRLANKGIRYKNASVVLPVGQVLGEDFAASGGAGGFQNRRRAFSESRISVTKNIQNEIPVVIAEIS
jgi:hypothetical protein